MKRILDMYGCIIISYILLLCLGVSIAATIGYTRLVSLSDSFGYSFVFVGLVFLSVLIICATILYISMHIEDFEKLLDTEDD